jgi:hypothetical protein
MAHVVVKVGDNAVESVITHQSAEDLGLKKGDPVRVVVKYHRSDDPRKTARAGVATLQRPSRRVANAVLKRYCGKIN